MFLNILLFIVRLIFFTFSSKLIILVISSLIFVNFCFYSFRIIHGIKLFIIFFMSFQCHFHFHWCFNFRVDIIQLWSVFPFYHLVFFEFVCEISISMNVLSAFYSYFIFKSLILFVF